MNNAEVKSQNKSMDVKDRCVLFKFQKISLKRKEKKATETVKNINKVLKHRKLATEMSCVTVFGQKQGLWISLRPEQSVKGTVGSP